MRGMIASNTVRSTLRQAKTKSSGFQIQYLNIASRIRHFSSTMLNQEAPTINSKPNPFELGGSKVSFKQRESSRPNFESEKPILVSKTPSPGWEYGQGPNDLSKRHLTHVEIDPQGPDRAMISNYKLLISAIPRPISFVSTISADGHSKNLAPFSYFQVVDHDPPIFVIGFSGRASRPKDTRHNLVETGECVISVVSEHMIEGVNATSLDVPYEVSEWEISGFEAAPSATVRPDRVQNAVFSVEGKLLQMIDLDFGDAHKASGKPSGGLAVIEGKRFWVREDAINEARDEVKLEVMRPLAQLGGISYGRIGEIFELPRPKLKDELEDKSSNLKHVLQQQKSHQ